jgi:hypothetical protein
MVAGIASLTLGLSVGSATAAGKGKALGKATAKQCAQERKAVGNDAFNEIYGEPAMPNCIGVKTPTVKAATKNASQECRAERNDIGDEAFANKYGSNKNKKNAFGKCVSQKAAPELSQDVQNTVNAAQQCKAERADPNFAASHGGLTFDQFYGTNANLKNAYGKCVSSKAKASQQS